MILSRFYGIEADNQPQQQQEVAEPAESQNANFWTRLGHTLGDFFKSVTTGFEKAFEGIVDFGASTVGVIAGWAGNEDLKQKASDFAARDLVEEQWQAMRDAGIDVDLEDSWIYDLSETGQSIVRGVGQGIGQMLPEVALALATGGSSAGVQAAVKGTNLAMLGMSAAGTATEEALNTDIIDENGNVTRPSLDRAYLYGLASGAVEVATEKLVGGVFEHVTGAGLTDGVINKISKKLAGNGRFAKVVEFALDVVGEGAEEMVSEAVGNTLKTIYNSSDGKIHWGSPDVQDVLVSGVVGSLTAAVMGGGDVAVRNMSKSLSIQDSLADISNNEKTAERRARSNKLDGETINQLEAQNNESLEKIAKKYQRASEKGQAKLRAAYPQLNDILDENGNIKRQSLAEGATEITADQAAGVMSGSLAVSRRTEVANKIQEFRKYDGLNNIKLAENLTETERANFEKFKKANSLTADKLKVVVVEGTDVNAFIEKSGDIVYIDKTRLASGESTAQAFSHESTHFSEGTSEFEKLMAFEFSLEKDGDALWKIAVDQIKSKGYKIDSQILELAEKGDVKGIKELGKKEEYSHQVAEFFDELHAHANEQIFGSEEVINRMIDDDRSFAKKVLNRIKDTIKILESAFKGDKDTIEQIRVLRQAEKLYADALANSGQRYARERFMEQAGIKAKPTNEEVRYAKGSFAEEVDRVLSGEDTKSTHLRVSERKSTDFSDNVSFSLRENATDSEGRKLSTQQKEYFKNTKVVDEKGDLLVVYHGSKNIFTQFDRKRISEHGSQEGQGIYFTDNKNYAEGYANENGQVLEGYLNIKKPLSDSEITLTRKQLEKIVRALDPTGDDLVINYETSGGMGYPSKAWYNRAVSDTVDSCFNYCDTDSEILANLANSGASADSVLKTVYEQFGYDGYIVESKYDSAKIYVAFDSSQFKNATNANPTSNTDIRYSLRENAVDSDGKTLSEKQKQYFKNTKIVDKNSNLQVVYHGTHENFTVFDINKTDSANDLGKGHYFTTSADDADKNYTKKHEGTGKNDVDTKIEKKAYDIFADRGYSYEDSLTSDPEILEILDESFAQAEKYYSKANSKLVKAYLNVENPLYIKHGKDYGKALQYVYVDQYDNVVNIKDRDDVLNSQYDGIIDDYVSEKFGVEDGTRHIVVFSSDQIKLTTNASPTSNVDIRYSNHETIRTDDKKARKMLLRRIEGMQLDSLGRYFAVADESIFAEDERGNRLMNQIMKMTNESESNRERYAQDLAESIVNNLMVSDVDPQVLNDMTAQAAEIKKYRGKLNLESIKGEIKSRYGEKNTVLLQWHNANGISVDDAIMELRVQGINITDSNIADGFFEMLDIVDDTKKAADKVLNKKAKQLLSEEDYNALIEELREDIVSFMNEHTSEKEVAEYYNHVQREADLVLENARKKAENIKKLAALEAEMERAKAAGEYEEKKTQLETEKNRILQEEHIRMENEISDIATRHKLIDKVWSEANALSTDHLKKFRNMSELRNDAFESVFKKLGNIKWRGELKKAGARKIMSEFAKWYSVENSLLTGGLSADEISALRADPTATHIGYIDKTALDALEYLVDQQTIDGKENKKALSNKELQALRIVLGATRKLLSEYDAVQVHNRTLVLSEEASRANTRAEQVSRIVRKKHGVTDKAAGLARQIMRPDAVIAEMFGGEDNALSQLYKDIQDGEVHSKFIKLELDGIINDFFKDHKSYKKRLSSETVKIGEHEIKLESAISLYMLAQQQHSVDGLQESGWGYRNKDGYWQDCGQFTLQDQLALEKAMTAEDKQFIRTLRKFFNKASEYQIETDKKYRGYSLIEDNGDSDYFPIKRYGGDMAKGVQENEIQNANMVSVANYSINKERVANKHRIDVIPVTRVLEQHSSQVSMYSGLACSVREFQRLYNCNLGKEGKVSSIRNTVNEKSWNGFNSYLTELLQDIQGVARESGAVNRALNTIRGHYATFQLGFNIKTILSQLSGFPAIFPYVHTSSMMKAFTHGLGSRCYNNMVANCEWARVKCENSGVVLAETLNDKLGTVGKIATAGVEWMDTQLNKMIWNACQCEVEQLHKGDPEYRFGTEKNMQEAARLHTEIGQKTQGNSLKSEGTAMQRSNNVIVKSLSMFNSDGFKTISCLYEGINRARSIRELERQGVKVDSAQKTQAKQYIVKSATAIVVSTMVYCAVAELMKSAFNKERKDKDGNEIGVLQDYGMEMLSQLVGMVPIARDIYSMLVEGYDVDNFATGGFTDLAQSMGDGFQSILSLAKNEKQSSSDYAAPLKKIIDSLGQITGIPTRNVYNTVYGAVNRIDESSAYKWTDFIYGNDNSYSKDLAKAMREGDEKLAGTIINLMLKNDGMTDTSAEVNNKLRELHSQGYTVLPKAVGNSFSFDGETYTLTQKKTDAFRAIYSKANTEVEQLIKSQGFNALDASVQAKSIKWIYDYYYENAVYDSVGEEADSKRQLFGETMNISKLAMTVSACNAIESKIDKKGNVIPGSKKAAILKLLNRLRLTNGEKLMILAYLGYSAEEDERSIRNYVSRIGLSKTQQKALLNYCKISA